MQKNVIQNLLAIGIDTVPIANSAKKLGYKVYAADYFDDVDLQNISNEFAAVVQQRHGKKFEKERLQSKVYLTIARLLFKKHKIDATLLSSGLDDDFEVLKKLDDMAPILGNPPETIKKAREKPEFYKALKRLDIACPETAIVNDTEEAKTAALRMGYPVVVKPKRGFGGTNIRFARNSGELEKASAEVSVCNEEFLVQEFIKGLYASMSILATESHVEVLTVNEQVLGLPFLFQREPFGYCGNIVPLRIHEPLLGKCKDVAEKIVCNFGLRGSNGIDLVISKEGTPYVIEVNPRFQGTLECVERVLGINLVESHINACLNGRLPNLKERKSFCTRFILYSPRRIVAPNLTVFREVRNIPLHGSIIEKGEPICSIITEAESRELSFRKARKLAKTIYNMLLSA